MKDLPPIDAVERKIAFAKAHPEVTFTVQRPYLTHCATWTDPETGDEETASAVWLGQLMDRLERKFGA